MWLMTPRGFFSAVQDRDDPDVVIVRARSKADLDALADLFDVAPYQRAWADYPWRTRVPKKEWAFACAVMAGEIDYGNFKDRVKVTNPDRAQTYAGVWARLLEIEDESDAEAQRPEPEPTLPLFGGRAHPKKKRKAKAKTKGKGKR